MNFNIQLTVGNRTFFYGSLQAYRDDMESRALRIKRLWANANRDSITPERKAELLDMLEAERERLAGINAAMSEQTRQSYA